MNDRNNKTVTLELSTTEALVLCDVLSHLCDRCIVRIEDFRDTLPVENNSFSLDDPELLSLIRALEVVRVASRMLLTLVNSLPTLQGNSEEIKQSHIYSATNNLALAESTIANIESQGVAIAHSY